MLALGPGNACTFLSAYGPAHLSTLCSCGLWQVQADTPFCMVQNVRKASAQLEANKSKIAGDFAAERKVRPGVLTSLLFGRHVS